MDFLAVVGVMAPVQILAALLATSVLANVGLGRAWLAARDGAATAIGQRDTARADASACSDATDDLRDLADRRKAEAASARVAAASAASALNRRADATLASAPTVPGDMCASMQALGDQWLQGRLQSDRH